MKDGDYSDYQLLFANTPVKAEPPLHCLQQFARGIGLYVNSDKTELMCFKQKRNHLDFK